MASRKLILSNPNEINILTFGSSLTEGYTDFGTAFHPYSIALEKKLSDLLPSHKVNITVDGRSGDRVLASLSGIFLQRLQSSLPLSKTGSPKFDFVIVLGGTNDLALLLRDEDGPIKIFEGLNQGYDHILKAGASLLCMTVPERAVDCGGNQMANTARNARLQLNKLISTYAQEHKTVDEAGRTTSSPSKVFLFDLAKTVPFPRNEAGNEVGNRAFWSDMLHFTAQGYDFVGEELAIYISGLL
jgi:lysophospholipase L1-like esterase